MLRASPSCLKFQLWTKEPSDLTSEVYGRDCRLNKFLLSWLFLFIVSSRPHWCIITLHVIEDYRRLTEAYRSIGSQTSTWHHTSSSKKLNSSWSWLQFFLYLKGWKARLAWAQVSTLGGYVIICSSLTYRACKPPSSTMNYELSS